MAYNIEVSLLAVSLVCGTVNGMMGASNFGILVPFLITFINIDPYTAIGMSLAADLSSASVSSVIFNRKGNIIVIKDTGCMIATTVLVAFLSSYFSHYIPSMKLGQSNGIVSIIMGISFLRSTLDDRIDRVRQRYQFIFPQNAIVASLIVGSIMGVICGVVGVSGGILFFIVLKLLYQYPLHSALGTALLIMAVNALFGFLGHAMHGNIPWYSTGIICIGAIFGALASSKLANRISEQTLSKIIGCLFILLGVLSVFHRLIK
jgi:hypothetical protein